jgi:mono/diheme cytochrome c family protein
MSDRRPDDVSQAEPRPPTSQTPDEPPSDLEPDVERLHRPIAREPRDPLEGREPAPWWLWAVAVLAIFWGGWYLGRFGDSFGTATHVALARRDVTASGGAATAVIDPVQAGRQIFAQRCQPCHQPDGKGLPGTFPPLVGSEWVTGPPETVVRILLNGLQGPVQVAGQTYNGAMPAWRDQLSNPEIAAAATYIRQWKPNSAPPVDSTLVAKIRSATAQRGRPWTAEELRAAQAAARTTGTSEAGRPGIALATRGAR